MKKYKILFILPALNVCGGMESFVMNYYRNMDHFKFEFHFLVHQINNNSYLSEIESYGDKVFAFPPFSVHTLSTIKKIYIRLLIENKYDIVHCNMANAAFLYLKIAKDYNVPVRLLHSHQNKAADTILHSIRNIPLISIGKRFANCNVACSNGAGDYLFGHNNYTIIPNCIDYSKYSFSLNDRLEIRKAFNFKDAFVIGHSGRLCNQKNQIFIIDLFYRFHLLVPDSKLLLIGEGEDKNFLESKVESLGLINQVIFTGSRSDVNRLLQGIDLFLFPSLYEGLGISVLEAQASGLFCLCSNGVPDTAKISSYFEKIDLNQNIDTWVDRLIHASRLVIDRNNVKLSKKYDIKENSNLLSDFYINQIERLSNGC